MYSGRGALSVDVFICPDVALLSFCLSVCLLACFCVMLTFPALQEMFFPAVKNWCFIFCERGQHLISLFHSVPISTECSTWQPHLT